MVSFLGVQIFLRLFIYPVRNLSHSLFCPSQVQCMKILGVKLFYTPLGTPLRVMSQYQTFLRACPTSWWKTACMDMVRRNCVAVTLCITNQFINRMFNLKIFRNSHAHSPPPFRPRLPCSYLAKSRPEPCWLPTGDVMFEHLNTLKCTPDDVTELGSQQGCGRGFAKRVS